MSVVLQFPLSHQKAVELNKGKPWSEGDDTTLRLWYAFGYPVDRIAVMVERTEAATWTRISKLKLKRKHRLKLDKRRKWAPDY